MPWDLPRLIIKSRPDEKWAWPWASGAPKILWLSFNICAMAEASNFKFGMSQRFAKAHHKITPKGNVGVALGWGSCKIFEVSL